MHQVQLERNTKINHVLPMQVLEAPLEKKAGINYGPPGTKHLVYFVDDLNMPKLDPYETAMPISLIRQHLSWGHWFGEHVCTLHSNPTCSGWLCLTLGI